MKRWKEAKENGAGKSGDGGTQAYKIDAIYKQ